MTVQGQETRQNPVDEQNIRKAFHDHADIPASPTPPREQLDDIKDIAELFRLALSRLGGSTPGQQMATRQLSCAATKIDEAVLWAQSHVEQPVR